MKQPKLYNLEEHISQNGVDRHVRTLLWNVPFVMCRAIADRARMSPHLPGTYWKSVENVKPQLQTA